MFYLFVLLFGAVFGALAVANNKDLLSKVLELQERAIDIFNNFKNKDKSKEKESLKEETEDNKEKSESSKKEKE